VTAQALSAARPDELLSVAEIQQAFRSLRSGRGPVSGSNGTPDAHQQGPEASHALQPDWIAVVAAHSGAGASTVALAVTDALVNQDERVRLIESALPARSGLVAAAANELGMDPSGDWRRGSRATATVLRRASDANPGGWPEEKPDTRTVVDLGLPTPTSIDRIAAERPRLIVVCRPTLPAVRLAEHVLGHFDASMSLAVAAVGPTRWPGALEASVGPQLSRVRADRRVISVPLDRRLWVTGPSHLPLPGGVVSAASDLLRVLASPCLEQRG
jgi:hypothetical protein